MARTTLAERAQRIEQQKARLALAENKIRNEERKARTRRLIEQGGLVEKAGLSALAPNALYGAMLSLAEAAADPAQLKSWEALGGRRFDREAKARDEGKEPLVLEMPLAQPAPVSTALRAAGLRWNKVMKHWEGLAKFDDVKAIADDKGGAVRRVTQPDASALKALAAE